MPTIRPRSDFYNKIGTRLPIGTARVPSAENTGIADQTRCIIECILGAPAPFPISEPGHEAQGPPIFQIVVLRLESVVRGPTHARRFRREVVFVLGGTAPLVVQALSNLASSVRGALIRLFALRGVSQAVARPAPEISPAIENSSPFRGMAAAVLTLSNPC